MLAFLQQREELWTKGWVEAEARRCGETPEDHLLAIFDLFHEWFQKDDFEGCSLWFKGPIVQGTEEELARIEAQYGEDTRTDPVPAS